MLKKDAKRLIMKKIHGYNKTCLLLSKKMRKKINMSTFVKSNRKNIADVYFGK